MKEREIREQMETELHRKEQELAETMRKQTELEMRFLQSNQNENEIRNENERLQKVTGRNGSMTLINLILGENNAGRTITRDDQRPRRIETVH